MARGVGAGAPTPRHFPPNLLDYLTMMGRVRVVLPGPTVPGSPTGLKIPTISACSKSAYEPFFDLSGKTFLRVKDPNRLTSTLDCPLQAEMHRYNAAFTSTVSPAAFSQFQ